MQTRQRSLLYLVPSKETNPPNHFIAKQILPNPIRIKVRMDYQTQM